MISLLGGAVVDSTVGKPWIRSPAGTVMDSTAGQPWIFSVRVVPPDRPRPRHWRALLRATTGCSSARCRRLSQGARHDLVVDGRRVRLIHDALGGVP